MYFFRYKIIVMLILVLTGVLGYGQQKIYAKKTLSDADSALSTVVQKSGIDQGDVGTYIGTLIKYALSIAGIIFFGLMVYAGLMWMTARGEEDKVDKARKTLIASTIGMIILVSSYAITTFVQQRIIDNQAGGGLSITDNPSQVGNEPTGCCYDWVKASGGESGACSEELLLGVETKAWRITTYADCKYFGEAVREGIDDCLYGPEGEGTWQFFEGQEAEQCKENR